MKLKKIASVFAVAALFTSAPASAADIDVQIVNLSRGLFFTPILVAAHASGTRLFSAGTVASANLQAMAEGGDNAGLTADLTGASASLNANPAGGLLAPGASTTASIVGGSGTNNPELSVVAMILPSNDGFIGLNGIPIPTTPGTYSYDVNIYDAGTEANDEVRGGGAPGVAGFPVPPPLDPFLGSNGTGFNTPAEGFVHIHRGVIGDGNASGGPSDIDYQRHRWLTPGARVIVTVK